MRRGLIAILAGAATMVLVACGSGGQGSKAATMAVTLDEWSVTLPAERVDPGAVRFEVTNEGSMPHRLAVIKSDLPPGQLPVQQGEIDRPNVNLIAEFEPLASGESRTYEASLTAGKYLLICTIVNAAPPGPPDSHYLNGMVAFLLAEPD